MLVVYVIFQFFFFFSSLFCFEPKEIFSLKQILPCLPDQKTLVVFDIDNTLLHPPTDLGSDQWFAYLVQEKIAEGISVVEAVESLLPLYFHVNYKIDLLPTEHDAHHCVNQLHQAGHYVICLTARSKELIEPTKKQLSKNQLLLNPPCDHEAHIEFDHHVCLNGGIIFCSGTDKGKALIQFLDSVDHAPECIIFVDDKEKYLHSVYSAVTQRGIPTLLFRYAGCDERVESYDHHLTSAELERFLVEYPLVQFSARQ